MPDLFTDAPKATERPTRCCTCGGTAAMWIPASPGPPPPFGRISHHAVRDIQPDGCAYCRAHPNHGQRAVSL